MPKIRKKSAAYARNDRKFAFTLAEVLITLTILGVIAVLVVPNIIQSYKRFMVETRLRQAYAIIENVMEIAKTENRGITAMYNNAENSGSFNSYFGNYYIKPYINYSDICENVSGYPTCNNKFGNGTSGIKKLDGSSANHSQYNYLLKYRIKLKNGMWIAVFRNSDYGPAIKFIVDINGDKGPQRFGYDTFYFSAFLPNSCSNATTCNKGDRLYAGNLPYESRENNSVLTVCEGHGHNCAAVIKRNGWKIPRNYPVKF